MNEDLLFYKNLSLSQGIELDAEREKSKILLKALEDIVYSEPKDNATTYPHAEGVVAKYKEECYD